VSPHPSPLPEGEAAAESDVLGVAQIGEPVPAEQTLARYDEVLAERGDGLEEDGGLGRQVLVKTMLPAWSRMHRYMEIACKSTPQ
jgi:hypothetical protein